MIVNVNGKLKKSIDGVSNTSNAPQKSQFDELFPVFDALGIDANPDALLIYWGNGLSINVQNAQIVDDQDRD